MTTRAYIADRIFTGDEWLHFYAMIVEDGTIRQLMPATCLPSDIEREEFEDCVIAIVLQLRLENFVYFCR